MPEEHAYQKAPDSEANWRQAPRVSMLRANIFALEGIVLLSAFGVILFKHGFIWTGLPVLAAQSRDRMLFGFGVVYFLRLNVMARCLLPRDLAMEELTVVQLWIGSIMASFAFGALRVTEAMSCQCATGSLALYLFGSWLNTWSELQRKWWKAKAENKGRCYTEGLFAWSRNVNYLGDVVLFMGWGVASGCWWNLWPSVTMAASFYWFHIPDKESYLRERYAQDWPAYEARTKSLIPFVC